MFLMLYKTFQCFINLICKLSNMKTNLSILLSIYSASYIKKIVKEIIKKSKKSIDKFGLIIRNIVYPLEATAHLSKIRTLTIFEI